MKHRTIAILLGVQTFFAPKSRELSYSDFKQKLAAGQVQEVVVSDTMIRGTLEVSRAFPSFEMITTVPVSATRKFPPVIPMSASANFCRRTPRANWAISCGSFVNF